MEVQRLKVMIKLVTDRVASFEVGSRTAGSETHPAGTGFLNSVASIKEA